MLSPTDFVKYITAEYPTLYYTGDFDKSALKIYNQLFNVIGNGIRDDVELHDELNKKLNPDVDYDKYFKGLSLFQGFTRVDPRSLEMIERLRESGFISEEKLKTLVSPDYDSEVSGVYTEAEKAPHENVIIWRELEPRGFSPYPNFQEEYSILYKSDFKKLGVEWIDAAIWFYTECQKYFEPELTSYYGSYPTTDARTDEATVRGYKECLARYNYKTKEEITKAYGGIEYTGDLEDFIARRWKAEKARINKFLVSTLDYLQHMRKEVALTTDSSYSPT